MNRRIVNPLITAVVMIFASLLISSCGFKPRGSGFESLEGQSIFLLSENPYGALERNIKKKLRLYSMNINNVATVANKNGIRILDLKTNKAPISVDINGRPAEFETIISVDTNFYFNDENEHQSQFSVRRDYQYQSNNNLAHDKELEILTSEMMSELSQRIVEQFLLQLTDHSSAEHSTQ